MALSRIEFQRRRTSHFGIKEEEDEDELKPSQVAAFQQKRKQFFQEEEKRAKEPEKAPEPEPEPEPKKPTIIEKVKGFFKGVADFVVGKKKVKDRASFKEEFGIVPETVPDEPHSYFDYHALSSIPVLQKRVNEIDVKQNQRVAQGKSVSTKLQKEQDRLNELIGLDNNSLKTVAKRNTEVVKISNRRVRRGVAAGAIDVADSFADAVSWLGRDIEGVEKTARKTSDKIEQWADYIRPEQPEFTDQLAQGIGSALTFFIPGIGVAKGVRVFAVVSPALALFFGNVAATALESASEAGSVYDDNIEAGKSEDEAAKKASNTFWANSVLIGITNRFGIFGDSATRLKKVLASGAFEGFQEYAQQAISNVNIGRPWDEGTIESGVIGMIIGGGMGSIDITEGQAAVIAPEPEAEVIRKPIEPAPPVAELSLEDQKEMLDSMKTGTERFESGEIFTQKGQPQANKIIVSGIDAEGKVQGFYVHRGALSPATFEKTELESFEITPKSKEFVLSQFEIEVKPPVKKPTKPRLEEAKRKEAEELMEEVKEHRERAEETGRLEDIADRAAHLARAADKEKRAKEILAEIKAKKPPVKKPVAIPKGLEPLAKEARKYKSAEEFSKAMGELTGVEINKKFGLEGSFGTKSLKDFGVKEGTLDDMFKDFYTQATKEVEPPAKKPPAIPEGLELFAVEARKYKSAEEFIKGVDSLEINELAQDIAEKARLAKEPWAKTEYGYSPKVQRIAGEKARQQLKDLYAQITKVKVVPKKPPVKPRAPKKVKKVKPPIKPAKIKLRKVKKPKARVFMASARKQLQQKVRDVVISGKTQEESVRNVDKFLADNFDQADDPLYERKLKAIRAELKRNMYELAGATTGEWKKDYAYFQNTRDNPDITDLVDRMEEGVFQIDDIVNPAAPPSMGLATTGTKPVGEFEKRAEARRGTDEFKLFEKTKELTRKYAKIIGEGYTPRKTLGIYYPKTKNIFVNALNNLSTVSHEIAHFLDRTYSISDKLLAIKGFATNGNPIYDSSTMKYRKAITDLYVKYYDGGKKTHKLRKRALEGFATLLQKYVESPQTITEEYPLLVDSFLKEGGKYYHPVMGEIIKDLNAIVKEYQGLNALDKVGSRVVTEDAKVDKSSFLNFRDKLRTFMADEIYPIEVLAKESKRHFVKADPSLWLRAYNNVSGIVNNNINGKRGYWTFVNGNIKKTHDFNWKTLHKNLETRKNTDDFNYYLIARREHFSYKELDVLKEDFLQEVEELKEIPKNQRGIKDQDGLSPIDRANVAKIKYQELRELLKKDGFLRKEVDSAYLQNKDRFTEEEKIFDALTREDLRFLSDKEVQLITPKQYEELTSKQGYASFKRQFYNEVIGENNEIPIQTRVGRNKISSLLRRKGSEQSIISPLTSAITNHSEIMRKGLKQVVYNKVTDIGVSAAFPNVFQELDLKVSVDPKSGAFFYPQEKDPSIIMGRVDYKRKPVLVDAEIKNVLDNVLTYRNVDTFARLYTGLSRLFTAGTTGYYPPFVVVNLLRDQITAQANTVNKYKTLYSPIKAFGKMLRDKNSEEHGFYEEYMVLGGERQTFTGWQKLPPDKLAQRIRDERSGIQKSIRLMEKGTNILSAPVKYSEIVTRATEYINARKAGKSTIVALEEAGRLTAPFHHLGSWGGRHGQIFIRGIPYFNAALQVLDQHARVAVTPDGKKRMLVVLAAITAAYLASMMALLDADDEQKEQYKDLKPEELARYLYFPHPSGKKLIRLPMSEVFTTPGTIFNMIIADEFMGAKYTQSDYIHAATAILPDQFDPTEPIRAFLSWIPQVFKTGIEAAVGVKTYPEVSPLESMAVKNLPPELRTKRNTSRFAKWLGKKTGLSPIKIDYLITGYAGRGINIALGKPDAWNFEGSVLREYWFSNGRRVSGTYDLREENDQTYTAYQNKKIELTDEERDEVYRIKMITNDFVDLMGEFREADIEEDEEKAAELRTDIILLMGKIEKGEEPEGFFKWKTDAKRRRSKLRGHL